MQPQGPPGGPYSPYGPPQGPQPMPGQPPYPAGNPYQPVQPYQQQNPGVIHPGQIGANGAPLQPRPVIPGAPQPAGSQYQTPVNPNVPPAPAADTTPYDFFMQPKPAQAVNPLPVAGKHLGNMPTDYNKFGSNVDTSGLKGLKGKFPLIAGGGIVLILILILATAFAPKDTTGPKLFNIAQTQQEIIRVCTQGTTKAKYRSTRYFAVTCSTSVTTNQKDLASYMTKQNMAYDPKLLGNKASSATDSALKSAQSSSTYDSTFRELVSKQLESYDSALTAQLGVTTGDKAREVLTKSQSTNQLLIKMVQDDSDKTEAPAEAAQ